VLYDGRKSPGFTWVFTWCQCPFSCGFVTCLWLRVSVFQAPRCSAQQTAAGLQQYPAGTFRPLTLQSGSLQLSGMKNASLKDQRRQCFLNAFKQAVWAGVFATYLGNSCVKLLEYLSRSWCEGKKDLITTEIGVFLGILFQEEW